MSMRNRNIPVNRVVVRENGKSARTIHQENVTVAMQEDDENKAVKLRIMVNKRTVLSAELESFKWLDESSSEGVAALESSSMMIIILYDDESKQAQNLFKEMADYLSQDSQEKSSETPPSDGIDHAAKKMIEINSPRNQTQRNINELVQFIENHSVLAAERAAEYLATNRVKVQFKLASQRADETTKEGKGKNAAAAAPVEVLKLRLQVECHLDRDPLIETIHVRSGTKLRELKNQIETETGIKAADQYWFVFDQYLLSDDYEFGSGKSAVPPRPVNAPKKQPISPKEPIRSGDKLIMCIAQLPPAH